MKIILYLEVTITWGTMLNSHHSRKAEKHWSKCYVSIERTLRPPCWCKLGMLSHPSTAYVDDYIITKGETSVIKTKLIKTSIVLKVHPFVCIAYEGQVDTAWCSAASSFTHPRWGRVCSLTHSDAWPHWKLLSLSADTAYSTTAEIITECQRALAPEV